MPLIKQHWIQKNPPQFKQKQEAGSRDILKMYKYFPNLNYPPDGEVREGNRLIWRETILDSKKIKLKSQSKGCYITLILMDSGYMFSRITKIGVARGRPGRFKKGEWKDLYYTEENPEQLRYYLKSKGWILPKGYWVGPPELKPNVLKKTPQKIDDFAEMWTPERLKASIRDEAITKATEEPLESPKIKEPLPSFNSKDWDLPPEKLKEELRKKGWPI